MVEIIKILKLLGCKGKDDAYVAENHYLCTPIVVGHASQRDRKVVGHAGSVTNRRKDIESVEAGLSVHERATPRGKNPK